MSIEEIVFLLKEALFLEERLLSLEEQGLIESETIKLTASPSPLPLPKGLAQVLLQEDRKMPELRLLTFDNRLHDAAAGEGLAATLEL